MATYDELRSAFQDPTLRNHIEVGALDVANDVLAEADATTNHANRIAYAFQVVDNTPSEALRLLKIILLLNKSATLNDIINASEAAIKTNIENVWNEFADAFVGA